MRVALINPRFRLPIDTRTSPHLGLAYLGAVSLARGDMVRVFDADVEEQPVGEFVAQFKPDLVGITANTPQVKGAWRTAAAVKAAADVPVVLAAPTSASSPTTSTMSRCASLPWISSSAARGKRLGLT